MTKKQIARRRRALKRLLAEKDRITSITYLNQTKYYQDRLSFIDAEIRSLEGKGIKLFDEEEEIQRQRRIEA